MVTRRVESEGGGTASVTVPTAPRCNPHGKVTNMRQQLRGSLALVSACAVSCADDPAPVPAQSFMFSAYAPVDGSINAARVDGADFPLVPIGSGYALIFEREYPNYATARQSEFVKVDFFQGTTLHHTGYLRPGQCGRDCSLQVCPEGGSTLKAEEVKYGLNAAFEPGDWTCKTCVGHDGTVATACH